jgi:hypothetical protein
VSIDLVNMNEARRAAGILVRDWPQTLPGLMTDFTRFRFSGHDGYAVHLYRAAIREATQGEG